MKPIPSTVSAARTAAPRIDHFLARPAARSLGSHRKILRAYTSAPRPTSYVGMWIDALMSCPPAKCANSSMMPTRARTRSKRRRRDTRSAQIRSLILERHDDARVRARDEDERHLGDALAPVADC